MPTPPSWSRSLQQLTSDPSYTFAMRLLKKSIGQNLAISRKPTSRRLKYLAFDKSTAPSGKGDIPAASVNTVEPPGECAKHTAESYTKTKNKALHLMNSYDESGSAFLSPVRSAMLYNNQQTTRTNPVTWESYPLAIKPRRS